MWFMMVGVSLILSTTEVYGASHQENKMREEIDSALMSSLLLPIVTISRNVVSLIGIHSLKGFS